MTDPNTCSAPTCPYCAEGPEDVVGCGSVSPERLYCTRDGEHDSPHVACDGVNRHMIATWPGHGFPDAAALAALAECSSPAPEGQDPLL